MRNGPIDSSPDPRIVCKAHGSPASSVGLPCHPWVTSVVQKRLVVRPLTHAGPQSSLLPRCPSVQKCLRSPGSYRQLRCDTLLSHSAPFAPYYDPLDRDLSCQPLPTIPPPFTLHSSKFTLVLVLHPCSIRVSSVAKFFGSARLSFSPFTLHYSKFTICFPFHPSLFKIHP